jgi:hypothetical protein
MRISFVLITVLALATSAHAALSLSINTTTVFIHETITVSVSSDNTDNWTYNFVLSEDTYNWTAPVAAAYDGARTSDGAVTVHTAAGEMACVTPNPTYAALITLSAGGVEPGPSAGIQFSVQIIGVQEGIIYVDLQDSSCNSMIGGALVIAHIPEPMTITLLALGGLLIRRRGKK